MEKQIKELAKDICLAPQNTNYSCKSMCKEQGSCAYCIVMAESLYNAGYRKQSEVIDEFVKRLIDAFPEANPNHRSPCLYYDEYRYIIEELAEEMKGGAE